MDPSRSSPRGESVWFSAGSVGCGLRENEGNRKRPRLPFASCNPQPTLDVDRSGLAIRLTWVGLVVRYFCCSGPLEKEPAALLLSRPARRLVDSKMRPRKLMVPKTCWLSREECRHVPMSQTLNSHQAHMTKANLRMPSSPMDSFPLHRVKKCQSVSGNLETYRWCTHNLSAVIRCYEAQPTSARGSDP